MNKALIYTALIFTLVACTSNDNDNGEPITGLSLPQKITAISANQMDTNTQKSIQALSANVLPTAFDDPGTDFSNDQAQSYFFDEGTTYVNLANYLLCLIDKTEYQINVNKGAYIAAFNYQKCYEENFHNSDIQIPNPIVEATVVSSRASNNSPHIIKIWLSQPGSQDVPTQLELPTMQTLIEIKINQAPTSDNPFGNFSLDYAEVSVTNSSGSNKAVEMRNSYGRFQAKLNNDGGPVFQDIHKPDDSMISGEEYSASTTLLDTASGGSGAIYIQRGGSETNPSSSILFDYNEDRVLKGTYNPIDQMFETQTCQARNETRDNLFGYNLYHKNEGIFRGTQVSAGQRVQMNTSFSFVYNGLSGWMDENYYWLENDNTLPDGAVITKQANFQQNTEQQLTAYVSPGQFIRRQLIDQLLSTLQGIDLEYYGSHPDTGKYGSWIVRITANNDFQIVRERRWTGSEIAEYDTYDHDYDPTTPEIPVAATIALQEGDRLDFYDRSHYQYYKYIHLSTLPAENRTVQFEQVDRVTVGNATLFPQGSSELTLYCYVYCIKGGLTQETVNAATNSSDLYYSANFSATPVSYTAKFDGYHIILVDNTNGLPVDAKDLDLSVFYLSSLETGRLVTEPLPQPATYDQLLDAPLAYIWTTGPYTYYHYVVLVDEFNNIFSFDREITIDYTYDASHDLYNTDPLTNPHHGETFTLTYNGPGSLWGLPYTNDEVGNYFPEVNLAAGTELSNDEGQYVLKAMWEFQIMAAKDISECSGLNVDTLLADPKMKLLTSADIRPVSFTAADKPVVNAGPVVKPDPQ